MAIGEYGSHHFRRMDIHHKIKLDSRRQGVLVFLDKWDLGIILLPVGALSFSLLPLIYR